MSSPNICQLNMFNSTNSEKIIAFPKPWFNSMWRTLCRPKHWRHGSYWALICQIQEIYFITKISCHFFNFEKRNYYMTFTFAILKKLPVKKSLKSHRFHIVVYQGGVVNWFEWGFSFMNNLFLLIQRWYNFILTKSSRNLIFQH